MKNIRYFLFFLLFIATSLLFIIIFVHSQSGGVGFSLKILDTTPPFINITKLAPTSITGITLAGTYSENDALANITIEFNSSYKLNVSYNTTSRTWSAPANLSEGWNKFYVLAYDVSGNFANVTSSSQGTSVLLDTTKPTINLTSPQNGSSVANNSLIIFKISDFGLANAFYTINSGATASFNSVYEIKAGTSDWIDGANYIIVNATDSTNNVQRKNFTFIFTNVYAVVLNNSIITAQVVINNTNGTINNLQDSAALQSLVNNFAASISVDEYNKTIQTLNVVANLSNAVNSIQSLLQDIINSNSSSQNNTNKTETINSKLEEISSIKNTTISSIDVNLFNSNLTVDVRNTTINNVTNQIIATVAGLSASDEQSFRDASASLQNKTTITNKVQTLTQTFLNGRTENITLFEKNVSISETQSGQFYVNEIIDKNITGNNDLNANTDITNKVSQAMTVVVADPTVSWSFSNAAGAVIGYSINVNVPSDNVAGSQTVVTTVPTSTGTGTTNNGGGTSGGGGTSSSRSGGGIATTVNTDFTIDKTDLKIRLKQGETKTETVRIKNTGTSIFDVKTILNDIGKFKISPEGNEVTTTLQPNEEKIIEIIFKALENEKPDIYPTKIFFNSPSNKKELNAIIEVDSSEPLFDVSVDVLAQSKKLFAGQELLLDVSLVNVRGFGRVDVVVEYSIKDLQGNVVATQHETLAVEKQLKFAKSISVPSDLKPGTYVAIAKVTYGDSVGVSSSLFEVTAKSIRLYPVQITDYRFILLVGALILVAGIFVYSARKFDYFRKKTPATKAEEIKDLKVEEKAQKWKKELEALEKAFKAGFISEDSYKKDKERINGILSKLK